MLNASRIAVMVVGGLCAHAVMTGVVVANQAGVGGADAVRSLAGVWKAPEYKVSVSGDLDVSVWGQGASKVRNVELALEPSGTGVLRVHSSVVDSRGRPRPYSTSVIEARLEVKAPEATAAGPVEPIVKVVSAEERYLDGSKDRRPIEGLTVKLNAMTPTGSELNLRFDTAQGTGSFGDTLTRRAKSSAAPAKS